MLKHAGNRPLIVQYAPHSLDDVATKLVMRHTKEHHSLRRVEVVLGCDKTDQKDTFAQIAQFFLDISSSDFGLQSIRVDGNGMDGQICLGSFAEIFTAPALTSVHLTHSFISMDPRPSDNLTVLILEDSNAWNSMTHMLKSLEQLPLLEVFSSTWSDIRRSSVMWVEHRWMTPVNGREYRSVPLPNLRYLRFEDIFEPVLYLLQYTRLPHQAQISLISGYIPDPLFAEQAGVALSNHFMAGEDNEDLVCTIAFSGNPVVSIALVAPDGGRLEWTFCGYRLDFLSPVHAARLYRLSPLSTLASHSVIRPPDFGFFLDMLRNARVTSYVTKLDLICPPVEVVQDLLTCFPCATEVKLTGFAAGTRAVQSLCRVGDTSILPNLALLDIDAAKDEQWSYDSAEEQLTRIRKRRPGLRLDLMCHAL
ncbi:hypothetical protein K488DRAFT_87585 [Vararia minispora EC-137]|uniref:Uncharacterized protein n=1 Tax=Vararia minispora EC-137 TaxID=1314806 RepID=A0ACB8QFZ6_9AGAM|nr:hypothetical protein K488DRAFT_87585 [Vararia minispora EC-137]